jgi:uncharacterized protein
MRRLALAVGGACLLAGVWDLSRAPGEQLAARAAIVALHGYQATLSRAFAMTSMACRFDPTCSHYGEAVLTRFGLVRGGWMAAKRVLRCGPWTPMGTADPPPTIG